MKRFIRERFRVMENILKNANHTLNKPPVSKTVVATFYEDAVVIPSTPKAYSPFKEPFVNAGSIWNIYPTLY